MANTKDEEIEVQVSELELFYVKLSKSYDEFLSDYQPL